MSTAAPSRSPIEPTDLSASLLANPKTKRSVSSSSCPSAAAAAASDNDCQPPPLSPDAEKAMGHTAAWKPAYDRRQSWSKQDQKHELQMTQMGGGGARVAAEPQSGFSERSSMGT
ncbi:hypothetical protein P8C59_005019 [Phyllachora maydis]|uniref:Uncharacterized protein n=1 Tax=Phyllachora maydis TaxID=1825666 RepID=A0AAD9I3H7_9PEZI|nr:hypothetical protein P8C59_005019 [Phyllachora maydis]